MVVLRGDKRIEREVELVAKLEPYQHPLLGILPMRTADDDAAASTVRYVYPEGPAAEAGIVPGDVLVSLEGEPIPNRGDLWQGIAEFDVGQEVELEVAPRGSNAEARRDVGPAARGIAAGRTSARATGDRAGPRSNRPAAIAGAGGLRLEGRRPAGRGLGLCAGRLRSGGAARRGRLAARQRSVGLGQALGPVAAALRSVRPDPRGAEGGRQGRLDAARRADRREVVGRDHGDLRHRSGPGGGGGQRPGRRVGVPRRPGRAQRGPGGRRVRRTDRASRTNWTLRTDWRSIWPPPRNPAMRRWPSRPLSRFERRRSR